MMRMTGAMDKFAMVAMNAVLLAAFPVSVVMFAVQSF